MRYSLQAPLALGTAPAQPWRVLVNGVCGSVSLRFTCCNRMSGGAATAVTVRRAKMCLRASSKSRSSLRTCAGSSAVCMCRQLLRPVPLPLPHRSVTPSLAIQSWRLVRSCSATAGELTHSWKYKHRRMSACVFTRAAALDTLTSLPAPWRCILQPGEHLHSLRLLDDCMAPAQAVLCG